MINHRLTAGVLISAILLGTVPTTALASTGTADDNYITAMTGSFSAGAHAAIGETVVLDDTSDDTLADITDNETPIVTEPEQEVPEQEVPEIADGIIEIKSISREAGSRVPKVSSMLCIV